MATSRQALEGSWADVAPLAWKSHRLARKVQSSLAAETMGIDEGIANGLFHRAVWTQLRDNSLDSRGARDVAKQRFPLVVVTDCKGAYDHLSNNSAGPSKDKRTALDIAIIRETMINNEMEIRWIDGKRQQVTDPLTKRNGNADLLRGILERGRYVLVEEQRALDIKEEERRARHLLRGLKQKGCESAQAVMCLLEPFMGL